MAPLRKRMRLSDQALIIFGGRLTTQVLQVVAGALLARWWTQDELGVYRQLLLVSGLIVPFVSFGLDSSPYFFIPKLKPARQKAFVWQMWAWQFLGGLIAAAVMYVGAEAFATYLGDVRLAPLLRIFSLFPLFTFFRSAQSSILISMQRPHWSAFMSLMSVLFQPVAVALGARAGMELTAILVLISLLAALQLGILAALVTRDFKGVRLEWDFALLRDQARYSLPLSISTTLERIMRLADKAIISVLFDTATYAVYSVGTLRLPFVGLLVRPIMDTVRPKLARFWHEGRIEQFVLLWHDAIRRTALLIFPLTALFFVLAEPTVVLLFSTKYAESVLPFRMYLLGMPAQILVTGAVVGTMGKTRFLAGVQSAMIIPTIFFGYILSLFVGWVGPAIGLTLTLYLREITYLFGVTRYLRQKPSSILPWKQLARVFLLAAGSGCAIYPVTKTNLSYILQIVIGGSVFVALYGALGYTCGVISKKDMAHLSRWLSWGWNQFQALFQGSDRQ